MTNRFKYKTAEELRSHAKDLGIELPWSEDFTLLFESFKMGSQEVPNRFVVHPMEGADAKPDGSPGDLTYRRYQRFANGGSGLIWVEATSVCQDGRSNAAQLYLHKNNRSEFSKLVDQIHLNSNLPAGSPGEVKTVIQLTHSGRYSKPEGNPAPKVACRDQRYDSQFEHIIELSDDELKRIRDAHVDAAILAEKAGFNGVDIKICHGYLFHEILFARNRTGSEYGGIELEKRIRILDETLKGIQETTRTNLVVRMNVFDGLEGGIEVLEAQEIISHLDTHGVSLWSLTAGIPYVNPWIGRPFDLPAKSLNPPPEHPLVGVDRLISLAAKMKEYTKAPVLGAGLSWLRQFYPFVAAGILSQNLAHAVGLGRLSFAYPDLPMDLFQNGQINPKKVCVACSGCTSLLREGHQTGCIIRDRDIYAKK